MTGYGPFCSVAGLLLLFNFDTDNHHADIPVGMETQRWGAGLHHSGRGEILL